MHLWLTVIWLVLVPPSLLWWRNSVPFLVFISVYAVIVGHWGAYEAARKKP